MLKYVIINCSCEFWPHKNKIWTHLKNNTLIKILVLNLLHKWHLVFGGSVTEINELTYLVYPAKSIVLFFFHGSSWFIIVNDLSTFYTLIYSKYDIVPNTGVTLNNSLSNWLIPSQD